MDDYNPEGSTDAGIENVVVVFIECRIEHCSMKYMRSIL